jgi:hypothetical protein
VLRFTKSSRESGFSILEAVVVIFLIGLIFGLITGLFAFGNRLMQRGGKRVDVSRTVNGLSREWREFGGSPVRLVTVFYPSGNPADGDLVISLPNYRTADGSRQTDPMSSYPLVQSFEVYYRDASDRLMSHTLTVPPSISPSPLDSLQLQAVVDTGLGRERLARCRKFELVHPDSGDPTELVSGLTLLRLTVESTDDQTMTQGTHLRFLP